MFLFIHCTRVKNIYVISVLNYSNFNVFMRQYILAKGSIWSLQHQTIERILKYFLFFIIYTLHVTTSLILKLSSH